MKKKGFNWSEDHLYRSNFLQNPYLGPFDFLDCIYGFGCGLLKQKEQEENIGATQSGASKGRFKALQVNAKNFFDNNRAQFYIYSWFLKPLNSQDFLLRTQNEALSQ